LDTQAAKKAVKGKIKVKKRNQLTNECVTLMKRKMNRA